MRPKLQNKPARIALVSFLLAGIVVSFLLASVGGEWGTAYGQTVPVPPSASPTNPPEPEPEPPTRTPTPRPTTARPTTAAPTTARPTTARPTTAAPTTPPLVTTAVPPIPPVITTAAPSNPPSSSGDLALSKSVNPARATAGTRVVFTVVVRNPGPIAASSVVAVDNVPTEFSIVSVTTSRGNASTSGQVVTVNIGTLEAGGTVTIQIIVVVRAGVSGNFNVTNQVSLTAAFNGLAFSRVASANVIINPPAGGTMQTQPPIPAAIPITGIGHSETAANKPMESWVIAVLISLGLLITGSVIVIWRSLRKQGPDAP